MTGDRDFNEEFQEIIEKEDTLEKFKSLSQLGTFRYFTQQ